MTRTQTLINSNDSSKKTKIQLFEAVTFTVCHSSAFRKKKSNVCLGQYNLGVYLMVDDRHHF